MFFADVNSNVGLFFALGAIAGIDGGMQGTMIYGMIPDTLEYGQWKTGFRSDAFNYAFTSLMMKWGGAAGPAVLGLLLSALEYVPNVAQSDSVKTAITAMFTLVPAFICLLNIVPLLFYKLDRSKYNQIVSDIIKQEKQRA